MIRGLGFSQRLREWEVYCEEGRIHLRWERLTHRPGPGDANCAGIAPVARPQLLLSWSSSTSMDAAGHYCPGILIRATQSPEVMDALISRPYMLMADRMDQQHPKRTYVRCGWQYLMLLNLGMMDPHTSEIISVTKGQPGLGKDVPPHCESSSSTTRTALPREG